MLLPQVEQLQQLLAAERQAREGAERQVAAEQAASDAARRQIASLETRERLLQASPATHPALPFSQLHTPPVVGGRALWLTYASADEPAGREAGDSGLTG